MEYNPIIITDQMTDLPMTNTDTKLQKESKQGGDQEGVGSKPTLRPPGGEMMR